MQNVAQLSRQPSKARLGDLVLGTNPRRGRNPAEDGIRKSIKDKGVLQSLLVRPLEDGRLEVRAGFTRFKLAMEELGEDYEVPINVVEMSDDEAEEFSLIENAQRGDMNPAEEAEAAARILARCGGDHDEAARRLGWSRAVLDKRLALMNCCEAVRDALIEQQIKLGHAELIAGLAKSKQEGVLQALLKAPELPTVGELKAQIQKVANALAMAIFDKSECAGCQHNSGNQQALFGEAISEGHCTNRECWDAKVETALEATKESLKDEFPEIRIVRPGENFTVIKLVAEGASGVGAEQAEACRACGKFGAAISAVPGKVGAVYKGLCFDAACNAEKVKANQQALLEAANTKAQESTTTADNTSAGKLTGKSAAPGKKTAKGAASVQDSTRVKEYRVKVWRRALAKHLATNPKQNERVLIALALAGDARCIDSGKVGEVFGKLAGAQVTSTADPAEALAAVSGAEQVVVDKMRCVLAASAADKLEENKLVRLLKALAVDLSAHWQLCEDFLALLTKSELEVVADQVGIKSYVGKEFSKLMSGKKEEIVKKLLSVDSFEYAGKVPSNMQFDKK